MSRPTPDPAPDARWHQVIIWCDDWHAAEQAAAMHRGPRLAEAEHAGIIASWWFVRKGASWRLRCLPAPGRSGEAAAVLEQMMRSLAGRGAIRWQATAVYEPETRAFGGTDAMDLAHGLFHADSRHLLALLRDQRRDRRRELGLLLCSALMRSAGQDWYEQGDIWARVAAHRAASHALPPDPRSAMAVRQLITARSDSPHSPLQAAPAWPAAFRHAGAGLAALAQHGALARGLRAVLAHHVLFAWNRAGIPAPQQASLAATASAVIFQPETVLPAPGFPAPLPVPELGSAR